MNNYRDVLINRHKKATQSQPVVPEKPLTWTQYQNKQNVRAWRDKFRAHKEGEAL